MQHEVYKFLKIDPNSSTPIYQQLFAGMQKFCAGKREGISLPSERELCEQLRISRTILRIALTLCVKAGFLVRRWGKGYSTTGRMDAPKRILILKNSSSDIADPYQYILPGIEQRAAELGIYRDILLDSFICNRGEEVVTKILENSNYTGILYLSYTCSLDTGALEALRKTKIPLYCPHVLDRWAAQEHFYCGCVNSKQMFADALKVLTDGGGTKIVTFAGEKNSFHEKTGIRGYNEKEYSELLESQGADPDPERIVYCACSRDSVFRAMDDLVLRKKEFDSVLCVSDFYAVHVIEYLKAHQYRIPEDVAVMGYCGFPGGQFLDPPLSTMDYQYHSIGYHAVDRLLEIASEKYRKLPQGGIVDPITYKVCIRESTRKAAAHPISKVSA
ncbi:MAG: substrate-binding domain-containing protein [Lentisphaeria bacterium]|nr:substrate-binding domain-containing protein [Lentisphaeria bacterium]